MRRWPVNPCRWLETGKPGAGKKQSIEKQMSRRIEDHNEPTVGCTICVCWFGFLHRPITPDSFVPSIRFFFRALTVEPFWDIFREEIGKPDPMIGGNSLPRSTVDMPHPSDFDAAIASRSHGISSGSF